MNLLAIETSAQICASALFQDGRPAAEIRTNIKNAHAAFLFQQIETVLHLSRADVKSLSAIAVSIGPGSFTGLRIGLAAAKGLALSNNIPLIGVPSLEAMVWSLPPSDGTIYVARRSRADEYYFSCFRRLEAEVQTLAEVTVVSTQEAFAQIVPPCLLLGDVEAFKINAPPSCRVFPDHLPSAAAVAQAALVRFAKGDFLDLDQSEPFYLQEFMAKKAAPTAQTQHGQS